MPKAQELRRPRGAAPGIAPEQHRNVHWRRRGGCGNQPVRPTPKAEERWGTHGSGQDYGTQSDAEAGPNASRAL